MNALAAASRILLIGTVSLELLESIYIIIYIEEIIIKEEYNPL